MCTVRFHLLFSPPDNCAFSWISDTLPSRTPTHSHFGLRLVLLGLVVVGVVGSSEAVHCLNMDSDRIPWRGSVAQRILCINCNIAVNTCNAFRPQRVLHLDRRVVSLLSSWISPVIITEEDYICEACFNLLMETVNAQMVNDNGQDQRAGPSRRGHTQVCLVCGRSLVNRRSHIMLRHNLTDQDQQMIQVMESRIAPRQILHADRSCHACWMSAQRECTRHLQVNEERANIEMLAEPGLTIVEPQPPPASGEGVSTSPEIIQSPGPSLMNVQADNPSEASNIMLPNFRRAPNTASHCLIFGCDSITDLHIVSDALRYTLFHSQRFYVPILARVCAEHLRRNIWDSLFDASNSISNFTATQIEHIFLNLMAPAKPFLDFSTLESVSEMDSDICHFYLGLSKENFLNLIQDLRRILGMRRGILGLAGVLIKMRTGESTDRLSTLLKVPRTTLERLMGKAREILLEDFVPRNLGINHKTREELLNNNLIIPNGIYNQNNENVIVICDGTYLFLNKSSNFLFQKDTYSLHKYRNLLKPFLLVCCNGYIIDCFGPYKATTSDAEIMTSLFRDQSPLRQYFQDNDIFILDRGFRDSINLLQNCHYRPYMPESLLQGEHQLTTAQANRSRCVTICRWVVEVVNGYFKRDYRLFRFDHFNKTVPHMMTYFKIAASLINKFGVRLQNRVDAEEILNVVRERMSLENNLAIMANTLNLNRRTSFFSSITSAVENFIFPRLEYNELILFALGTYQIRLARSYYGEHIRSQGEYIIEVSREPINVAQNNLRGSGENTLVRGKIKSRHIGRRQYYVYILVENRINGREGIVEYCCSCLVGRRTVGCCAHVMSIVWYLGWARYQANIVPPAPFLDDVILREDVE